MKMTLEINLKHLIGFGIDLNSKQRSNLIKKDVS